MDFHYFAHWAFSCPFCSIIFSLKIHLKLYEKVTWKEALVLKQNRSKKTTVYLIFTSFAFSWTLNCRNLFENFTKQHFLEELIMSWLSAIKGRRRKKTFTFCHWDKSFALGNWRWTTFFSKVDTNMAPFTSKECEKDLFYFLWRRRSACLRPARAHDCCSQWPTRISSWPVLAKRYEIRMNWMQ